MIKFLKSLFKSDPNKRLIKERDRKYSEAVSFQRNGNLREYARLMKEIDDIEESLAQKEEDRSNITSTDFIDYDGMGNQGRFPTNLKD